MSARAKSTLAMTACAAVCAATSLSCGASDGASDFDGCDLQITVETAQPTVGSPVRVSVVNIEGTFFTPSWTVRFDGGDVPFTATAGDDTRIDFTPELPGPYEVVAGGNWSGGTCLQGRETINATLPGAIALDLRVRLTPPAESGQAPADRSVRVFGGADYALGDLELDTPVAVSGIVSDGGAPVAAQIRVTSSSGQVLVDGYADTSGAYSMTLPDQTVDIAVMPADPDVAPLAMTGVDPASLGDIDLAGAVAISGVVTAPGGGPMAGARVVLRSDGLPSSLGITGADGSYTISARPGASTSISVTPPAASGLPIAELDLADNPAAGSDVDVAYAALAVTSQSFVVTDSGGSPAAGARVVLIADGIAGVAAVSVDGAAQGSATGRVRRFATADGSGAVDNLALADAVYTALAEPGAGQPGRPSMASADTTGGAALSVQLAGASIDWIADLGSSDGAVEGARVRARPLGAIAALSSSSSSTLSDAAGDVSLPLIGGASYEIQIDPPSGLGRALVGQVTAPASGTTDAGAIALARAIRITGRVRALGGTGTEGVHLGLYCTDCATPEIPIAEGLTDRSGRFAIELPDPGIGQ